MATLLKKFLKKFKDTREGKKRKKKGPSPTEKGKEDKSLARLWNRLRRRVTIPNFALEEAENLHRWAEKLEEKFSRSENEEDREAAKLFRAVKKRAFSKKFFEGSVKVVAYRTKTLVKGYRRKIKTLDKRFKRQPKSEMMRRIKVRSYVKTKGKRWKTEEIRKIVALKVKGLSLKEIAAEFPQRTYSSIATKLTRLKKSGKFNEIEKEVRKMRKRIRKSLSIKKKRRRK